MPPTETIPSRSSSASGKTDWLAQYYTPEKSKPGSVRDGVLSSVVQPAEKYEIGDGIGTGGMKSVTQALDRNAGRHVAMARLKPNDPRACSERRFLREARITAGLEHPNIVPIHEIGVDESGGAYFTMKLLDGETLHRILKKLREGDAEYRRVFPLSRLLEIFLSVCNAIAFAHTRGVLHLDLKPENIQVGGFGEVLVLDWGLARVIERDGRPGIELPAELVEIPEQGVVIGTPQFMAPEQARGDQAALDERTDVHALGTVLDAILGTQKNTRARKLRGLLAAVQKARADDPAERYATVDEFSEDIRAYLGGFPTAAQEASLLTQLWLLVKRHRSVATLCGVSLAVILTILTVAFVRISNSEQVAVHALAQFKAEQERHRRTGLLAAPHILQRADEAVHQLNYEQALAIFEYVLTLDPSLGAVWQKKVAIHLGRMEFDQAIQTWLDAYRVPNNSMPKRAAGTLFDVARKYQALPREASGALPANRARGFVYDLIHADTSPWSQRLLALACFFQQQNRNPATRDFGVVEFALRELNRGAPDFTFAHKAAKEKLDVAVHGVEVQQLLPLIGLPITSLDLAGTSVTDLNMLRYMPLTDIDLSRTKVSEFQCLSDIATLSTMRLVGWRAREFGRMRYLPQLKRLEVSAADLPNARAAIAPLKQKPELVAK